MSSESSVSIHIEYKQKQKHIISHEMGYWLYNAIDHHIPNIAPLYYLFVGFTDYHITVGPVIGCKTVLGV